MDDWNAYKPSVEGSRQAIVFPFFVGALSGKSGIGLDIGCGQGDLTGVVADVVGGSLVGFDINDEDINRARKNWVERFDSFAAMSRRMRFLRLVSSSTSPLATVVYVIFPT